MIPADAASRLRLIANEQPAPPQPASPSGKITDVLSDLVPGQRVMAEIQALLPNGTYRAIVAQRDVTLALPFSAKTGDALELEVVESDGKLTLAFVANRTSAAQTQENGQSVATTLSRTGQLISQLLDDANGQAPQPVPLNGNRPLLEGFSGDAAQLAPALKEAITRSGMFYEAHQADWVEGKLETEALLQEPQGKRSPALHAQGSFSQPLEALQVRGTAAETAAVSNQPMASPIAEPDTNAQPKGSIPVELGPLVRQQLDALATQNYLWQGQVWPGQQLHWEIEERDARPDEPGEIPGRQWQTRLKLSLPNLGTIDAIMTLQGTDRLQLSIMAGSETSQQKLAAGQDTLRQQLDLAGLSLADIAVRHGESSV